MRVKGKDGGGVCVRGKVCVREKVMVVCNFLLCIGQL